MYEQEDRTNEGKLFAQLVAATSVHALDRDEQRAKFTRSRRARTRHFDQDQHKWLGFSLSTGSP